MINKNGKIKVLIISFVFLLVIIGSYFVLADAPSFTTGPLINSTDGTNDTSQDLWCSFTPSGGGTLTADIIFIEDDREWNYTGTSYSSTDIAPEDIEYNGSNWFEIGQVDGDVEVYDSDWTHLYTMTNLDSESSIMTGIAWNGTRWFMVSWNDNVYEYYDNWSYTGTSYSVSVEGQAYNDIYWNGTHYFLTSDSPSGAVYEYLDNFTYTGVSHSVNSEDTNPESLHWDGVYWWMAGDNTDSVYRYYENWTYTGVNYDLSSEGGYPTGIYLKDEYWYMLSRANQKIYKYYSNIILNNQPITTDVENSFMLDSDNTTARDLWSCQVNLKNSTDSSTLSTSQITITGHPNFEPIDSFSKNEEFTTFTIDLSPNISDTEDTEADLKFTWTNNDTSVVIIEVFNGTEEWNYTGTSYSSTDIAPEDIEYNGSNWFEIGQVDGDVEVYDSDWTHLYTMTNLDSEDSTMTGIAWNGTRWFMVGWADSVYEYYDNWTYTGTSYSVSAEGQAYNDIYWNGTHWFLVSDSPSGAVYEYLDNFTYTGVSHSVNAEDTNPESLHWDGVYWWMAGDNTDSVYRYYENWTYTGVNYDLSSEGGYPTGIYLKDEYWYMLSRANQKIYKYYSNTLIKFNPVANGTGSADINITVWDTDGNQNSTQFIFTVNAVNDQPWNDGLTNPSNVNEDSGTNQDVIAKTTLDTAFRDVEDDQSVKSWAIESETGDTIIDCYFDGSHNVDCDTIANQSGSNTVTLKLGDSGNLYTYPTFTITVDAVNDAPWADQLTLADGENINDITPPTTGIYHDVEGTNGDCDLIINHTSGAMEPSGRQTSIADGGGITISSNITLTDSTWYQWAYMCTDGDLTTYTVNRTFLVDITIPNIESTTPAEGNTTVTTIDLTADIDVTDINLYQVNITLKNKDTDELVLSNFTDDLNGSTITTFEFRETLNMSDLGTEGNYTIEVYASDTHTFGDLHGITYEIESDGITFSKGTVSKKIYAGYYKDGTYHLLTSELIDNYNVTFKAFKTEKNEYKFNLSFLKPDPLVIDKIGFAIQKDNIKVIDTNIGHFIFRDKWYFDFEDLINSNFNINYLDAEPLGKNYHVIWINTDDCNVGTGETCVLDPTLGGLNIVVENYEFLYDATSPSFESINNFAKDEDFTEFIINLSENISDGITSDTNLLIEYALTNSSVLTLAIDNSTNIATFTSVENISGQTDINFTVFDELNNQNSINFTFTINPLNDAPWKEGILSNITSTEDIGTITVALKTDLDLNFSDVEENNAPTTYEVIEQTNTTVKCYFESDLKCDSVANQTGFNNIKFSLNDSEGLSIEYDFNVTLLAVNDPHWIDPYNSTRLNITGTPSDLVNTTINITENESVEFNIGIEDVEIKSCYQETANISTSCGGLDSGLYLISGIWKPTYPESNVYDGDWTTFSYGNWIGDGVGNDGFFFINYTKPSDALSTSLWQVKIGYESAGWFVNISNYTIPQDCWNQEKLELQILSNNSASGFEYVSLHCYDGNDWNSIDWHNYSGGVPTIFEEAMIWDMEKYWYTWFVDSIIQAWDTTLNWFTKYFDFKSAGEYNVTVMVNDSDGQEVNLNWTIGVENVITMTITGDTYSPTNIYNNQSARINATITPGDGGLDTVWINANYTGTYVNYSNSTFGFTNDGNVWSYFIDSGNFTNQDNVSWQFIANDTNGGEVIGAMQSFIVQNRNATIDSGEVAIAPDPTASTDDLNCTIGNSYDYDGETVNFYFHWYLEGVIQSIDINSQNLSSGNTTNTENWKCGVIPYDIHENGTEVQSQVVTIGSANSAPTNLNTNATTINTVIISDATNPTNNDSSVTFTVSFTDSVDALDDGFSAYFCKSDSFTFPDTCGGGEWAKNQTNTTQTILVVDYAIQPEDISSSNNYYAFVTDNDTVSASKSGTFHINHPPENLSSYLPLNESKQNTRGVLLYYSGQDTDSDEITYYIYISNTTVPPSTFVASSTVTSYNYTVEEKTYYWYVWAKDSHNYYSVFNSSMNYFSVDYTIPNNSISASNYASTSTGQTATITIDEFSDNTALDSCYYKLSSLGNPIVYTLATCGDNFTLDATNLLVSEATYTFYYFINDTYGNENISDVTFTTTKSVPSVPSVGGGGGGEVIILKGLNETCTKDLDCSSGFCDTMGTEDYEFHNKCLTLTQLCGNGYCDTDKGEDVNNCKQDCGAWQQLVEKGGKLTTTAWIAFAIIGLSLLYLTFGGTRINIKKIQKEIGDVIGFENKKKKRKF